MSEKSCNFIGGGMKQTIDLIYPVGRTIMCRNNPQDDYPWQTWSQDFVDRFPVGAGSAYSLDQTGGEATHTLTVDEMPAHNHIYSGMPYNWATWADGDNILRPKEISDTLNTVTSYESSVAGGSQPHNNLPPYKGVHFWTRTA